MALITFVDQGGGEFPVDIPSGYTLMEGATENDVPGIVAECGGGMTCGTCHVFIQQPPPGVHADPDSGETDVLGKIPGSSGSSRLSCQVEVSDALDGLTVVVPGEQVRVG